MATKDRCPTCDKRARELFQSDTAYERAQCADPWHEERSSSPQIENCAAAFTRKGTARPGPLSTRSVSNPARTFIKLLTTLEIEAKNVGATRYAEAYRLIIDKLASEGAPFPAPSIAEDDLCHAAWIEFLLADETVGGTLELKVFSAGWKARAEVGDSVAANLDPIATELVRRSIKSLNTPVPEGAAKGINRKVGDSVVQREK